ncbi:MAG: glycosyltransferase family 4 protein [Verrucomicrobia bacterium]|nr:glycosyltransferase family 4 protein [Verrucomicrobiota bacterium]
MYCGNCFRDNALVAQLRRQGHSALMVPLYLPLTLDEADQSAGTPLFFGGVNVYLDQKSALYRKAPAWLRRWLDSPALLRWAGGRAAKTRAEDVGDLMLSMLRGEEGNQVRELDELISWLASQPQRPDVVCLSNALLAGLTRQLRARLRVPVVSMLQGEDAYLDSLPASHRDPAWQALRERAVDVELFIAPSQYYADVMRERLALPDGKVRVVHNGISLEGYADPATPLPRVSPPTLGFFARLCREKGLDRLVDVFIELKRRGRVPGLRLKIGGGCGPADEPFLDEMRRRLRDGGCFDVAEFHPNLERARKVEFYGSLSVLSVPALYGEAFGLYLIEAMAAGVPVVQPRHGAFPELIEATGGGLVCEPITAALADGIEQLLLKPDQAQALGEAGRRAVFQRFSVESMANRFLGMLGETIRPK